MPWLNSNDHYGSLTKIFHWIVVILFAFQFAAGYTMLSLGKGETALGYSGGVWFSWHKSVGLIVLAFAVARLINRTFTSLPDWAPGLSPAERRIIPKYEKLLYLVMFFMPISGYIYVMAGGYGVNFFGMGKLPNPIGKIEELKQIAKWAHILCSYGVLALLTAHLYVVLKHQFVLKDGLLKRMLPR